ncbi:MAG: thioredoxin domain-containing protein [Propionibacteriaceae bacterium]|nr:thioredoxin domain-containing protein [Propionibacteriaceae bacterium]
MANQTSPDAGGSQKDDSARPWKIATAVLSVLLVAGFAVFTQGAQRGAQPGATTTVTVTAAPGDAASADAGAAGQAPVEQAEKQAQRDGLLSLPRRQEGDPMAKGRVDAPVVMTEWADYRCPFCSVFGEQTLPKLQPLIDDGTLRIEFRDFAIFGDDSVNAAAAARAAGQQGRFWEYQLALYQALPDQGHPPVGDDLVMQIAQQVGVADMARFEADYRAEETRRAVKADSEEAQQLGVKSTPTFVVGGQVVSGAQPVEVFQQVIEQEKGR